LKVCKTKVVFNHKITLNLGVILLQNEENLLLDYDVVMSYQFAYDYVEKNGWDAFLDFISSTWPEKEIYAVNKSWFDNRVYNCKAKGVKGDLLITWATKN